MSTLSRSRARARPHFGDCGVWADGRESDRKTIVCCLVDWGVGAAVPRSKQNELPRATTVLSER
eukprot:6467274-Prymnesium_polylepis.1